MFWTAFCKSSHFPVKFHSKITVGNLFPHLPYLNTSLLLLDNEELEIVIDFLTKVSVSLNHEVNGHGCIFSTKELLSCLHVLLHNPTNVENFVREDVLIALFGLLVSGNLNEQQEALLIIWRLTTHKSFGERSKSLDLPLMEVLLEIESGANNDMKKILSGILPFFCDDSKCLIF